MRFFLFFLCLGLFNSCSNSLAPDTVNSRNIVFDVAETSYVEVWIENSYQTKMITIVDQQLGPGTYEYPFEMKDNGGKSLPYGLYTVWFKSGALSRSTPLIYQPDTGN